MNHSRRYILWMFVAIIVSLGIGLWLGAYLYSRSPRMREVNAGKNKINTILNIIDTQYVDTVNMNDLVNKTAASLISELDPHSVLIPAENVQAVNDDLEGSFSGIGVSFNVIKIC